MALFLDSFDKLKDLAIMGSNLLIYEPPAACEKNLCDETEDISENPECPLRIYERRQDNTSRFGYIVKVGSGCKFDWKIGTKVWYNGLKGKGRFQALTCIKFPHARSKDWFKSDDKMILACHLLFPEEEIDCIEVKG